MKKWIILNKLKTQNSKLKANQKQKTAEAKPKEKATPNKDLQSFKVPLTELLEAGCHFGHQAKRWNPKMSAFIYATRDGVHIFDLAQTAARLAAACAAAKKMVAEGKDIVFVGTKRQAQEIIKEEAGKAGAPYVAMRWLGGTITNWEQLKKRIDKLQDMKAKKQKGEYAQYTKKENLLFDREINRLEKFFGGLTSLKKAAEALFIVDTHREVSAVAEARQNQVKLFAIVDSNSDPTIIDYPVPANDDAVRSLKLIISTFAKAVKEGMELREKKEAKLD